MTTRKVKQYEVSARGFGPLTVDSVEQARRFVEACPRESNPQVREREVTVTETDWQVVELGDT